MKRTLVLLISGLVLTGLAVNAQTTQTWDPDGNSISDGGAGTWNTTSNFWLGGTTWGNGNNAIFGDAGANYTVDLASGVTVGDLTYQGADTLWLKSLVDNNTLTLAGNAAWDTGGGSIRFLNNQANDTALNLAGNTLTVNGGGLFDTGEKGNGANWGSGNLVFSEATAVRGATFSIGQLNSVTMAGGSSFRMERNVDQTLANDWVLGAGTVTFDNRYQRNFTLSGDISGTGGLKAQYLGNRELRLYGNNTFLGGLEVSTSSRVVVQEASDLGSADNDITLSAGGILKAEGVDFGSSRDIILNGTGGSIINAGVNSFGGNITGDGDLQIGNDAYSGNVNVINLSGTADYTGDTKIRVGEVILGADEAMGSGVLTLGGANTARLRLNGQTQTIGGLLNTGSKTKQIVNLNAATTGSTRGTLILDVADGASYSAGSATGVNAADDRGNFNIVKNGLGTQELGNVQIGGDVTVNAGTLEVGNSSGASTIGGASVTGGTLLISDTVTGSSYATSAGGTLQVGDGATAGSIGNVNIANDGAVVFSRTDALSYGGVISGSGDVTYSAGNNAVTLSSAQTYTGDTTINKAVITAQQANTFSADSALIIGGAGGGTSAFDINGLAQEVGGLAFGAGSQTREVRNNGADATLTLNVATGESYAWNANFAGSGTIDLVKTGDGTQTFGRSGGYSTALGDVTVSGGELVWNNNNGATQSGTVSVGAGGTLSGSGVLGGALTVAGNLNPGNSPGTMTFNDALTLDSTATLTLEFTSTATGQFDVLANDGGDTLTAGGVLDLVNLGYTATLGDSFTVFTNWSGFAGSFSSTTGTDLGGGLSFDTTNLLVDGTITVIPEPATLGMVALMGGAIFWIRRVFMV